MKVKKFILEAWQTIWTIHGKHTHTTNYLINQYISDLPADKKRFFVNRDGDQRIPLYITEIGEVTWITAEEFAYQPGRPGLHYNGKPFWEFSHSGRQHFIVKTV